MLPLPAGREASAGVAALVYERHRPERTLLYQLVQEYYPALKAHRAAWGTALPAYVEREIDDYLRCGRIEHGFMRVRCNSCHAGQLVAFSCKKRGFCPSCGARPMAEGAALLVDEVFSQWKFTKQRNGRPPASRRRRRRTNRWLIFPMRLINNSPDAPQTTLAR